MKFALIDGQRQEAQPNLSGVCQTCDRPMVAKCGERRIWHWAHQARSACDPWWENETEWHRTWKGQFPVDWQEVVQRSESGEKHIADVKTAHGWVLEFQHSHIKPEERRSRDAFYSKLLWVVDGTRRKRDSAQFRKAWDEGLPVNHLVRRIPSNEYALLREWAGNRTPIFFDFGDEILWWLLPSPPSRWICVAMYSRAEFIETHRGETTAKAGNFDKLVKDLSELTELHESYLQAQTSKRVPQPLPRFQQRLTHIDKRRKRF